MDVANSDLTYIKYRLMLDLYNRGIVKYKSRGRPSMNKIKQLYVTLFEPQVILTDIATLLLQHTKSSGEDENSTESLSSSSGLNQHLNISSQNLEELKQETRRPVNYIYNTPSDLSVEKAELKSLIQKFSGGGSFHQGDQGFDQQGNMLNINDVTKSGSTPISGSENPKSDVKSEITLDLCPGNSLQSDKVIGINSVENTASDNESDITDEKLTDVLLSDSDTASYFEEEEDFQNNTSIHEDIKHTNDCNSKASPEPLESCNRNNSIGDQIQVKLEMGNHEGQNTTVKQEAIPDVQDHSDKNDIVSNSLHHNNQYIRNKVSFLLYLGLRLAETPPKCNSEETSITCHKNVIDGKIVDSNNLRAENNPSMNTDEVACNETQRQKRLTPNCLETDTEMVNSRIQQQQCDIKSRNSTSLQVSQKKRRKNGKKLSRHQGKSRLMVNDRKKPSVTKNKTFRQRFLKQNLKMFERDLEIYAHQRTFPKSKRSVEDFHEKSASALPLGKRTDMQKPSEISDVHLKKVVNKLKTKHSHKLNGKKCAEMDLEQQPNIFENLQKINKKAIDSSKNQGKKVSDTTKKLSKNDKTGKKMKEYFMRKRKLVPYIGDSWEFLSLKKTMKFFNRHKTLLSDCKQDQDQEKDRNMDNKDKVSGEQGKDKKDTPTPCDEDNTEKRNKPTEETEETTHTKLDQKVNSKRKGRVTLFLHLWVLKISICSNKTD